MSQGTGSGDHRIGGHRTKFHRVEGVKAEAVEWEDTGSEVMSEGCGS